MTEITLPGTIDTVEESAIVSCTSLTDVYYPKTRVGAERITFGMGNNILTGTTWHFETVVVPDLSRFKILLMDA